MRYLFIFLLVTLSGCVGTYKVSRTISYWEHPDKTDSSNDYQDCKKKSDDDKEMINKCMNDNGWIFVVKNNEMM